MEMAKSVGNGKTCEECRKPYSETLYGPIGLSFCADCWYNIDSDEEWFGTEETKPNRKRIYEDIEECEMEEEDEQDEEGKEVDYADEDSNQNETDDSFSREMWEYIETKSQDVSKSDEEKEKLD